MKENDILIGSHCSMNGPSFYKGTVEEALSYGANVFMFYTGAPQNSMRKPLNELKIEEGRKLIKEHGIDESKIIVHAPYIVNPANPEKPELRDLSVDFLTREVKRTAGFGCKTLVLHPGNHLAASSEEAIKCLAESLDRILEKDGTDVKIALETMAGKGTEIGKSFEEIAKIISLSKCKNRLGVCLDTCHISDAGYNIADFDHILDEFDRIIGLDRLLVIHLNDSKNPMGAHKDRHENVGYGEIGFDILCSIAHNPRVASVPKILETPYYNEKAPYQIEIKMLRNKEFVDWK